MGVGADKSGPRGGATSGGALDSAVGALAEAVDPEALRAAWVWADEDDSSTRPVLLLLLLSMVFSLSFLVTSFEARAAAATNASRLRRRSERLAVLLNVRTDSVGTIRLAPFFFVCDAPLRSGMLSGVLFLTSLEAPAPVTVAVAVETTGVTWCVEMSRTGIMRGD